MKILITTDWYEPVINGVVTSVVNLSNELKKRGHEVKILTLEKSPHIYSWRCDICGVSRCRKDLSGGEA